MATKPIKFYEGPYYLLSNFSAHQIVYKGTKYPTSEHAYQVAKFKDEQVRNRIKNASSAYLARQFGRTKKGRNPNFDKVAVMKDIMRTKMKQHKDVREALKHTGKAVILKNYPDDSYWGLINGKGLNIMGKIWMELRDEL